MIEDKNYDSSKLIGKDKIQQIKEEENKIHLGKKIEKKE